MTVLTFGKHKGSDITTVPADYLKWGVSKLDSPKWRKEFQSELNRRDAETQALLNTNPDELLKKLEDEELKKLQREIAESGSAHEYEFFDEYSEAENRAKRKLEAMQAEKALDALKIEYAGLLTLDLRMMDMMENEYHCDRLSRRNFASEKKYSIAMEYFKKKNALLEVAMSYF
ncbi:MAG: hypothetical protein ACKPCP_15340 [Sphaerospermopsis kisseleviana]